MNYPHVTTGVPEETKHLLRFHSARRHKNVKNLIVKIVYVERESKHLFVWL